MAGAAGDGVLGLGIGQLREVVGVEIVGHFDHESGLVFDRVRVGGEVVALGLRVASVAVLTLNAERAFVLVHDVDDLISGEGFGKNLEVGRVGTRSAGWSRGLCRRSGGGSVLSQRKLRRKRYYQHCWDQEVKIPDGPKESIHFG
jgi:hypothetical protein